MTEDEARKIATQAIDTWPNGPKGYVWQNELLPLDADLARAAMRRLRHETDRATTAQFHAAYNAERFASPRPPEPPARCEPCDGTGWVTATHAEAHNPRVCRAEPGTIGCACHAVKPCRCTTGRTRSDQIDRWEGPNMTVTGPPAWEGAA